MPPPTRHASRRAPRRAPRRVTAALAACSLGLALSTSACVPVAVGAVVVGGAGVVAGIASYEPDCHDSPCALGNGLAVILGLLGGVVATIGGVYLLIDQRD